MDDRVERVLAEAVPYVPTSQPGNNGNGTAELIKSRSIATVEPEIVKYLWYPYIPIGKLTMLEGDPGAGKSWLSLAITAAVTLGHGLPGSEITAPGPVYIASAEDGIADTIRPRLDALHANTAMVEAADELFTLDETGIARLENTVREYKPVLLIIDPLVAYIDGSVDIHKANMVRHITAQLARLAETYGIAILVVRHLTKGGSAKPIYRGLGSIDFTAAARSVLLAGIDPDTQERGFVHIKCNLAPLGKAVGYQITDGEFFWTGESELTAARIFEIDVGDNAIDKAKSFLRVQLADGEELSSDILKAANEQGIKERTLYAAKKELKVVSRREGKKGTKAGRWYWSLGDGWDG